MKSRALVLGAALTIMLSACGGATDEADTGQNNGSGNNGTAGSSATGGSNAQGGNSAKAGSSTGTSGFNGGGAAQGGSGQAGAGTAGSGQAGFGQAGFGQAGFGQAGFGQGGQSPGCVAQKVSSVGACDLLLGYFWDGNACVGLGGCSCEGPDCASLYKTYDACRVSHDSCTAPFDPCKGKVCGDSCNPCPPDAPGGCPAVLGVCDTGGQCVLDTTGVVCGGQCKVDSDCPQTEGPCQVCPDGSVSCPSTQCINGTCQTSFPTCSEPCAAQDAVGVGNCTAFFGFAWDGKSCVAVGGCDCKGADCGKLSPDPESCLKAHASCGTSTDPCQGKACGEPCSTCPPGAVCPPVIETCNQFGQCVPDSVACQGCMSDLECQIDGCNQCPDGSVVCAVGSCTNGTCTYETPQCPVGPECKTVNDCPVPPCLPCPDGTSTCPDIACINNQCVYSGGGTCGDDVCANQPCGTPCCPPDQLCDVPLYCDSFGQCLPDKPICGLQCKSDLECPAPGVCEICPDGSTVCAQGACVGGQCQVVYPTCDGPCAAQDAQGFGDCFGFFGYAWNGSSCVQITGCECVGTDCGQLTMSIDECTKMHDGCINPQCKADIECPVPKVPCQACADGSSSCPEGVCSNGTCSWTYGGCLCDPQEAKGDGLCDMMFGYAWDGQGCYGVSGCNCYGSDCDQLYKTPDECMKVHSTCGSTAQCKVDTDCPVPELPCKVCADGSSTCPEGVCTNGVCSWTMSGCLCDAQDAVGEGFCAMFFGYAWDGKSCTGIGGCSCVGADCDQLYASADECNKVHSVCGGTTTNPCSGKKCGDTCSTCPPGEICPPVVEYCDINGACSAQQPVCVFP